MKIYISYFYKIRFFTKNMIPLSTAIWDPKWYHDFKESDYIFKDKNQVYNGLRIFQLQPGHNCHNLCSGRKNCEYSPDSCLFLRRYREQLNKLDFTQLMLDLKELSDSIKSIEKFDEEPIICIMVYETPDNPCSERVIIKEWFHKNGYELEEWN